MPAGPPKGNINAEKWPFKKAKKLMDEALELSFDEDYDFVGEICQVLKIGRSQINYLADKYPELKQTYSQILENCETNCFRNSKRGKIREATAIVNLKSNYKWTDRIQQESDKPEIHVHTKNTGEVSKLMERLNDND